MTSEAVFKKFVPEHAVTYCNKLYQKLGFEFKIKKARQTKLGDYRYDFQSGKHTITVNNDLNPYSFLVTYLHEVAHLIAMKEFGGSIQPHGKEWKECFKDVATPLLSEQVFEPEVLKALNNYFKNPKATSCSDPMLHQILRRYDHDSGKVLLKEVPQGEVFTFNKKTFRKLGKRRTRFVCEEITTGRKYLVPQLAEVLLKN